MENISNKVTISNAADISVIVGYFVMVLGVGFWVSVFHNHNTNMGLALNVNLIHELKNKK